MKVPKQVNRHCPYCNKHSQMTVSQAKRRGRNQARPLSRGSRKRARARGVARGMGNTGRYSKPTKLKMGGKKQTKKTDFRYRCKECKKFIVQKQGTRAKKVELI